jgi:VWFA-related protein
MNRASLALAVALASATLAGAQGELPPVFRARVEAVEIDAFVTDAKGNPVTNLTVDDFELLEDGVPQTITAVSMIDIPIERADSAVVSPAAIEPDVFTNHGPEGRLYVFALDEVEPAMALRTRHFMRRFVEQHLAANDVAAVVWMGRGSSSNTQDFTSNRRLLLNAIDRFQGGFPEPPCFIPTGCERRALDRTAMEFDPLSQARAFRALAEFMAKLHGRRKTLIWVTERIGDAYEVLDYAGGTRSMVFDEFHAAMTAATRGNVSIYPINPRGLDPEGTGTDFLDQMTSFRALAEATGGRALTNSNSFDQFFERIVRENSSYYVLGFTSTNEKRDGRYRRIQVRVKRPGLVIRARDGYVAPLRAAPAARPNRLGGLVTPVAEVLGLPVISRAVPMAVFAAPFKGDGRNAKVAVTIELDPEHLGLMRRGDTMAGEIQVAMTAVSAAGKIMPTQHQRVAMALGPDIYETARTQGLRVLSELALPAGRYQLRVAAGNVNGQAGAVMHDLEVPDFTKGPLVMSGIAVTSDRTSKAVSAFPREPLRGILPAPPTAAREFPVGAHLTLYSEVYENSRSRGAHTVTMKALLRSSEGRLRHAVEEELSSREVQGRSGSYRLTAGIPLDVEPGLYVIHVEARGNGDGSTTVSRDVQIRVK